MPDFDRLEHSIVQALRLCVATCAVLLTVTIVSLWFAASLAGSVREASLRAPVVVVPGAVGGTYTPGVTEETIRGIARYLVGLATNFSGAHGFDVRFDELETFVAPQYLPQLQAARRALRHDVESQNQARTFIATPGDEDLRRLEDDVFEYAARGERAVYASGLPLDVWPATVRLRLRVGSPTSANRTGVLIDRFDVTDGPHGQPRREGEARIDSPSDPRGATP
jgi:hypothetical protein